MNVEAEWFSPDPDETVVWTGQPRIWRIWGTVANTLVVSVVAVVGAYLVLTLVLPGLNPNPLAAIPVPDSVVVWGVAALVVGWKLVSVVAAYLRVEKTDYVLTDRRVYRKDGILSEHVSNVGVDRVQETTLSKDMFGNAFDYGTVTISTAGSGGADLVIDDLNDPETFRDRLNEQVRNFDDAGGGDGPPTRSALDAETADALLAEARGLHDVAERLEESV
jgi:uncharacterized membrane protein YdbT with pleckstrin-like domain